MNKNFTCICGAQFNRSEGYIKHNPPKYGKFFCSKKCSVGSSNRRRTGEKHPNWTHGQNTYRHKYLKSFCEECGDNRKYLLIVHHKDKDRLNNQEENLTTLCHNCHALKHLEIKEGEISINWNILTSVEVLKALNPELWDVGSSG